MESDKRLAVVTGGNRGLGFETCRQLAHHGLNVILTSRDITKGEAKAAELQSAGLDVTAYALDVTDPWSIEDLAEGLHHQFGRVDILVNNAGIMPNTRNSTGMTAGILNTKLELIRSTLETNTYGPILMCQALVPLMRKHNYGRIVNVSSGMGQLAEMNGGYPHYRISKTALNAVTRILANELKDTNIKVNSVCPGWVRTDMGGPNAERSIEEGADTIVWLATLDNDGPSGLFFRDRRLIPW